MPLGCPTVRGSTIGIIAKGWRGVIDEFVQGAHATGVTCIIQAG
jgi:hypothetical protein